MPTASEASHELRFQSFLVEDDSRLELWQRGIHAAVQPGDVVLDLGAGMGILSLFACQAGASRVYAVEPAPSRQLIGPVAEANGFGDRIVPLAAFSHDIDLPEPADVLVTDTLETFGLNGRILSNVIDARARLLKPGARLLPAALELSIVPVHAAELWGRLIGMWGDPARGLDVSGVRPFAANNMYPIALEPESCLAVPAKIAELDLAAVETPAVTGAAELTVNRAGEAHGLAGFFTAELAGGAAIRNGTDAPNVTYRQAFLPFERPLALAEGDVLSVGLDTYDGAEWRWSAELRPAGGGGERMEGATLRGLPDPERTPA